MRQMKFLAALIAAAIVPVAATRAATFSTANTADAGSYGTLTGQGFMPSLNATPNPGTAASGTVYLRQFQFFKGAPQSADSAGNLKLVILNGAYPNLAGLTTASADVVGVSTNTIASTATFNSGDAITFAFADLPLTYGNTYAAGLFTQSGTSLTPATVSALTANYSTADNVNYFPTTNYGGTDNYQASAYGGVSGGYYSAYSHAGDANFFATLSTTPAPEPTTGALVATAATMLRR